jgi:hypothetical protein
MLGTALMTMKRLPAVDGLTTDHMVDGMVAEAVTGCIHIITTGDKSVVNRVN